MECGQGTYSCRKLRAGTLWVNTYNGISSLSPLGGYKMSGFGQELGMHALGLYTPVKSVWINMACRVIGNDSETSKPE